jgi:hypothetical protein
MSEDQAIMPACPNCGADGSYRQWREVTGGSGLYRGVIKIESDTHRFMGSDISALVCTYCGNIQFFVDPQNYRHRS